MCEVCGSSQARCEMHRIGGWLADRGDGRDSGLDRLERAWEKPGNGWMGAAGPPFG